MNTIGSNYLRGDLEIRINYGKLKIPNGHFDLFFFSFKNGMKSYHSFVCTICKNLSVRMPNEMITSIATSSFCASFFVRVNLIIISTIYALMQNTRHSRNESTASDKSYGSIQQIMQK